jgi:hypothetical protein
MVITSFITQKDGITMEWWQITAVKSFIIYLSILTLELEGLKIQW